MKCVCFCKKWIEEVSVKNAETYQARILVIKFNQDDPSQYTPMVNAIFACQKLKILIDSLIISEVS